MENQNEKQNCKTSFAWEKRFIGGEKSKIVSSCNHEK
jgi:hypothetical protein